MQGTVTGGLACGPSAAATPATAAPAELNKYASHDARLSLQIDLTGNIGRKRVCSLASRDYENQSTEAIDMCILDHG